MWTQLQWLQSWVEIDITAKELLPLSFQQPCGDPIGAPNTFVLTATTWLWFP